ncbi:MAG: hypothetical protein ACAF41_30650 [Leptolyngbya sp. BL-A-14]
MTDKPTEQPQTAPETEAQGRQKGLSREAWAAVSAISVALISGAVAIITTIIPKPSAIQPSPLPSTSGSTAPSPIVVSPSVKDQAVTADVIANRWSGQAKASSGELYTIQVEIRQYCKIGEKCGTISVLQVPCYGEISLKAVQNDNYEFNVSNFDGRSSLKCTPGAGEHFSPLPDGKLAYRADWGVQGILDKIR